VLGNVDACVCPGAAVRCEVDRNVYVGVGFVCWGVGCGIIDAVIFFGL